MATFLPLKWISNGEGILIPGVEKQVMVRLKRVDAGYLATLDIPVLAGGRSMSETERRATRDAGESSAGEEVGGCDHSKAGGGGGAFDGE